MDYQSYVLANYTIATSDIASGDFLFFYSQGSYDIVNDIEYDIENSDFDTAVNYGANYYNRFLASGAKNLVSFAYCFNDNDILFFNSNKLDYGVYGSSNGVGTLYGKQFADGDTFDDLSTIDNYYNAHGYNPIGDFGENNYYSYYNINLTGQNPYAVFDYYNLKYENRNDALYVSRGENMSFYYVMTELSFTNTPNSIYFSYGAPYYTIGNSEYERGESAGFASGWVQGNENGYQIGINQTGNITQAPATAFDYIGSAFGAVGNVLSLEVLPNITLGLVFSIPMVFVLIMTIFKLVRK